MYSTSTRLVAAFAVALLLSGAVACSDDAEQTPQPDGSTIKKDMVPPPGQEAGPPVPDISAPKEDHGTTPGKDAGPPPPPADQGVSPDFGTPIVTNKVAAVQFGSGQGAMVAAGCAQAKYAACVDSDPNAKPNSCSSDICAMEKLTMDARAAGAQLVVLSEYGIDQLYYEPQPQIGENPGTSSNWPAETLIKTYSIIARKMQVYLVFDLLTYGGTKPNYKYYNTQIAFDPTGKVVGMHFKFNLFGNESSSLTAGSDVSVFDTPMGKTGLLICADIYGSATLLNKLSTTLGAQVVAVSSYWTVNNPESWYKTYASKYKVYAVVSNHTHTTGYGGGVYGPSGTIAEKKQTKPSIVYAEIPKP